MKIAVIDEVYSRGKAISLSINSLIPDAELVSILGSDAAGPQAPETIRKEEGEFEHIFVHHAQLHLAKQLCKNANIIQYSAFYDDNAERQGGYWIKENVSENEGASESAILTAVGIEQHNETEQKQQELEDSHRSKNRFSDIDAPLIEYYGAWHALASDYMSLEQLKPYLKAIEEQYGGHREVDKYLELYEEDPKKAFKFALEFKSSIKNRGPKDEQSLRGPSSEEYEKREFYILLVDDNDDNFEILERKFKRYLHENDESLELRIHHIKTTQNLVNEYKKLRGLQAVIFDDRFPNDVNISELIKELGEIRRGIPFYISGSKIESVDNENSEHYSPLFLENVRAYEYKDEKRATALFDAMVADLKSRTETPYFSALNKYATERKSAFHALPITDGGALNDSSWTREFTDFYKRKFFAAETSNTKSPLSSVFSPQGSLKTALDKAANAYNSDKSYFITSGTTVSNLLVYKIHIRKGDVVLLDWNCHKSHHNAMVECGAKVKYLKSEYNHDFGLSGLVSKQKILEDLKQLKQENEPVKMISLTHPSFDGMLYDVEEIMREANKIYPGIIFFFDEAWFAYGAFFPEQAIRNRSAMLAAENIRRSAVKTVDFKSFPQNDVRVYVTQSIHKTLSSIRQGSMLHIHDPYLVYGKEEDRCHLEFLIQNAYETYITTSPNNSILASLDVARMQAEVEGHDRINRAITCVEYFKNDLKAMCDHLPEVKALGLRVIESQELIPNGPDDNVLLDPLKVTLYFDRIPGAKVVKSLNEYNIQINKYSANTVLLLFSIGVTRSNVSHLLYALRKWAKSVRLEPFSKDTRLDGTVTEIPEFHREFSESPNIQITCLKKTYDKLHSSQHTNYSNDNNDFLFSVSKSTPILNCLTDTVLSAAINKQRLVAAQAITPYPPGSPVIVPGQILTKEILKSLISLKQSGGEIHGVVKNSAGEDCIIVAEQK